MRQWYVLLLAIPFLSSCGKLWSSLTTKNSGGQAETVTVEAAYPINGKNWMDWVLVTNPTNDYYTQPDTACTGSSVNGWNACIHGGEIRKVTLTGYASCSGITASDALSAFNWVCKLEGGVATLYSSGLKTTSGLKYLVNSSGWIPNSVSVYQNGTLIAKSASAVWWSNPVKPLPNNSSGPQETSWSTSGTIYVVASNQSSYGYVIDNSKVAIVTLSGATLTYNGPNAVNCDRTTGINDGTDNDICLITSGTENYDWVEGSFDEALIGSGTGQGRAIFLYNSIFSKAWGLTLGHAYVGIIIDGQNNWLVDAHAQNCSLPFGLGSTYSFYSHVYAANQISCGGCAGIALGGSHSLLTNFESQNDAEYGLELQNSTYNTINQGMMSNDQEGILFNTGNSYNILSDLTIANQSGVAGAVLQFQNQSNDNTFVNITLTNNYGGGGLGLTYGNSNTFVNMAFENNSTADITVSDSAGDIPIPDSNIFWNISSGDANINTYGSTNGAFKGFLDLYSSGGYCSGVSPCCSSTSTGGVVNNTCTSGGGSGAGTEGSGGSGNYGAMSSTAILHVSKNLASSFVGKMSTADADNTSPGNPTPAYNSTYDFFDFENLFRGWGLSGLAFPDVSNRGYCNSGTCQFWDWRLSSLDTMLLNRSGDGNTTNTPFVSGSSCPSAVSGNNAITDAAGHTFLLDAVEMVNNHDLNLNGNNDGLCESGETCIYSPNIGSYQGDGDPTTNGPCTFSNGTVSNVTMYAYPANGD